MKLILLFQWEFKQGSCGDLVRVCRFRLNLQISLKLLFTRGFIHWGTFDSGLSLFVQFPEGEWKSYFWLTHSLLTVVLSRSCTRLQYCSMATKRSSNSFKFSWRWKHVIKQNIWVILVVCVCVCAFTWLSWPFRAWTSCLRSSLDSLSAWTSFRRSWIKSIHWGGNSLWRFTWFFYYKPPLLVNSNWEINTLFREKDHNPFCLNFEEG